MDRLIKLSQGASSKMPVTTNTGIFAPETGTNISMLTPDAYCLGTADNHTDGVSWDGSFANTMTVNLLNPVIVRVRANDYDSPATCSVFVYYDVDTATAEQNEALWQAGLLQRIDPSVPDRRQLRVLELKITPSTRVYRKFNGQSNATAIDGSTTNTTTAVPVEVYNALKLTAKQSNLYATSYTDAHKTDATARDNPRWQFWPRFVFTSFVFRLYNNVSGMPTNGMTVGATMMAELLSMTADFTNGTYDTNNSHYITDTSVPNFPYGRTLVTKMYIQTGQGAA